MKHLVRSYLLLLLLAASHVQAGDFIALAYHDIRPEANGDPMTTTLDQFKAQLTWLRENGYRFVSMQTLTEAQRYPEKLPEKAVLLTFDDGYRSFYDYVLPLLKEAGLPAVLALATHWLETRADRPVQFDTMTKSRSDFLSWDQIRTIAGSDLVEIASHSHDLHHGIPGNPYGDLQPAATTRLYAGSENGYESDEVYRQRIKADLQLSAAIIRRHLGQSPRVLV